MNNWKVIFATVVIFAAGVLAGGLLVNHVQQPDYRVPHKTAAAPVSHAPATNGVGRPADSAKPRLPEVLSKQFLQRLDENLQLGPEQHEVIQKIINEGQNQMRKVIQDARLEIREVLTPAQRKQFDDLVKRPLRKSVVNPNAPVPPANPPATNAPPA